MARWALPPFLSRHGGAKRTHVCRSAASRDCASRRGCLRTASRRKPARLTLAAFPSPDCPAARRGSLPPVPVVDVSPSLPLLRCDRRSFPHLVCRISGLVDVTTRTARSTSRGAFHISLLALRLLMLRSL